MSLGITVIDHVQIAAPRALEPETLRFYREILGLT
jgi:catechol 2,3-dioxygenase-like lactoylglutathione lyase family enzyme